MTVLAVQDAAYPTPFEIRDILLRTIAFTFQRYGLVANVLPGSDHYIRAEAYASRVSIAIANNQLALQDFSPLSATGDSLVQLAGVFGVFERPAAAASGQVTIKCTTTIIIPDDFQLSFGDGQVYETTGAFTRFVPGGTVDIIATVPGASSNQLPGALGTWASSALGALNPTCTVTTAGLTGGADADDDDRLRARLLRKLAFPAVGGNWSSVVEWAEESTASVQEAFCYPAVRGPGSYDVAVVGVGNTTLASPTLAIVAAYILSKMPGQNDLNVTSVTLEPVDVTVALSLPLPTSAGGAGGGWLDASPWPVEDVKVTAYNSGTFVATCNATVAPPVGASIALWDGATSLNAYSVVTSGGTSGAYTITVQQTSGAPGFVGGNDPTGQYISANAVNLSAYVSEFGAQVATLGPGEKSADPWVVPRGRRQPQTDSAAPSRLSNVLLSHVQANHPEISDYAYGVHYLSGTTIDTPDADLPPAPTDPPNLLTLTYFAVRPA